MESKESTFKLVSIGIVAADKQDGTRFIEVYPTEKLPFITGEITDEMVNVERTGATISGEDYTINLKRSMTVKAEWRGETHRRTAPNVMKGEQVELYTVGESERYYWLPFGRDDKLRTTERVIWSWAARSKAGDELTDKNTYFITVDTKDQHITLYTSAANGELTRYTLQVNCGEGHLTFKDKEENTIQLDTANTKITLINADGTYFTLDKKNIDMYAPDSFTGKVDKDFTLTVGNNYTLNVTKDVSETIGGNRTENVTGNKDNTIGGDVTNTVAGTVTENVTGSYRLNAASYAAIVQTTYTVNGVTVALNGSTAVNLAATAIGIAGAIVMSGPGGAPGSCEITGDITQTGNSEITGNFTQTGNMDITGNFKVIGNGEVTGDFKCGNLVTPTWNGTDQADHLLDT